ncbi:MAG: PPOX class F420-dependent oxidoreductase [Chloroflexi bacterium]|nr:PPOX class F420-dependent oxidoreductase [Chloroflexota bacterium]
MISDKAKAFAAQHHMAVLTTHRKNGGLQMSIVTVGPYADGIAFTTTDDRAKLANLRRDPRCALLVSKREWWGYLVLDGHARILDAKNTDTDKLRMALREVYRNAAGKEHPDWAEYDEVMRKERRAVIVVVPDRESSVGA